MSVDFTPYKVLIIDDNDFVRHMVKKQVTMFGFEKIYEASEGFEGINKVNDVKPDVIICDINMEPLDGFDFLMHLRRLSAPLNKTPVIFLTSHGNKDFVEKAKDLQADAYLLKPVLPQKLYAKIRKVLNIKS